MKRRIITSALLLILFAGLGLAQSPVDFKAVDPLGRNTVQFRTSAPLEDIVGITNKVGGEVRVDPQNLKGEAIHGRLEVDLVSLQTGIALRDTHLREQYLHTRQYPKATFTLNRIVKTSSSSLTPNQPVDVTLEGRFELHGVAHDVRIPVQATYLPESPSTMGKLPGNLLRIQGGFDIRLADYKVERPKMVMLKVGEVAHVTLDIFATDAGEQKMAMWMEQMKKKMGSD